MALPANVGKGTVTVSLMDGAGTPKAGEVVLEPVVDLLKNVSAEPRPVMILPDPVTIPLVNGEGTRSDIIATDDEDNNPQDWNWRATFRLAGNAKIKPFEFKLPQGTVVDLTAVAPVASSAGVQIIRGPGIPEIEPGSDGQVLVLVDGKPAWGDGGGGGVSSWNDLTDKPATFTPATHTHAITSVTGLQAALEGKQPAGSYAAASHTHAIANVTGLQAALNAAAASGTANVSYYTSGAWQPRGASPHPWTYDAGLTDPVPVPTDWQPGDHIISLNPPTP